MGYRKIIVASALAISIIIVSGWASLYFAADRLLYTRPQGELLASSQPDFDVGLNIPGTRLLSARVLLNGEDVSRQAALTPKGLRYVPDSRLEDGPHTIQIDLRYHFLVERRIVFHKAFTVDTEPPPISFAGYDGLIATAKPSEIQLKGVTEPGAAVAVKMNGEPFPPPNIDDTGIFRLGLDVTQEHNSLDVTAIDLAGNKNHVQIPVVLDARPPEIKEMVPGADKTMFSDKPQLRVVVLEPKSALTSASLTLNAVPVEAQESSDGKVVTFTSGILRTGSYQAALTATDSGGNTLSRQWSFRAETTKLVIDLAGRKLHYWQERELVKTYRIAIGMEAFPTPTGDWTVVRKQKNPTWHNPHSDWSEDMPDVIGPGPGNPLGTRALYLDAPGIRIHGTYQSLSIGQAASHGCLRMTIKDSEELFQRVPVGVPVHIS